MLIGVSPAETQWLSWSEIQRERIRIDRAVTVQRRAQMADRLAAAKIVGDAAAAAVQPLDAIVVRLDAEAAALPEQPAADEAAFEIGHLKWSVRGKARALYGTGKPEDAIAAIELVVRNGCRGHRNFRDAQGAEIPVAMLSGAAAERFPVLGEATFETYAASGVAEALASVILDFNTYAQDRAKN